MHTLTFRPDDILFFRDGRPMSGSLMGHGDALPHPHIINSALHVGLHRAFPDRGKSRQHATFGKAQSKNRRGRLLSEGTERFGDLLTTGPFPAMADNWFFPAPADIQDETGHPLVAPLGERIGTNSLNEPLLPLVNALPPEKDRMIPGWLNKKAFESYLKGSGIKKEDTQSSSAFFSTENTIGIGMDSETGSTKDGAFFSKAQLRLREECSLGVLAEFRGKTDLLDELFPNSGKVFLGGETRSCSVERVTDGGHQLPVSAAPGGRLVKWVLLTPTIFPFLSASERRKAEHRGGWLPSWVDSETFEVQLMSGVGHNKAKRLKLPEGQLIKARLISALIQRPVPITGWSIREDGDPLQRSGARSTLLAVPAGSIYYFEAADPAHAAQLCNALSWHGPEPSAGNVVNRRSALMGEKGFGIGVCAPWQPFEGRRATS